MVYLLFFLSGAAALVYEIAWSRELGIFFGHTVHAAAVVLGAYFAGMALGYWLAALLLPRIGRPLAAYGTCELCVAAWAAVTPVLLAQFARPELAALLNNSDPGLQLAVRAACTFAVLLPATTALGATLPFIAGHVSRPVADGSKRQPVAAAYAWNTAGAFTGVVLVTYLMILALGVRGSNNLAACLSALCGLGALTLSAYIARREPSAQATGGGAPVSREAPSSATARIIPVWYVLAALSGAGTLGLQVLYTRMFALTFHNSTYTFGGVVAAFLLALTLGGAFVARYAGRFPVRAATAWACIGGALAVPASVVLFERFTRLGYFDSGRGFATYIAGSALFTLAVVMVPVAILGTVLPYTWIAAGGGAKLTGQAVGRLTSINTLCATAGSLLTSFLLLEWLGLWKSFALFALVYLLLGIYLLLPWLRSLKPLGLALGAGLLTFALCFAIQWPMTVVYQGTKLLFERETPYGLISVLKTQDNNLVLRENNHYTLGATTGSDSERIQGLLPILLSPQPRDVCFLGLATGITAGAALCDRAVDRVTIVELVPAVVDAARLFNYENCGLFTDDRSSIVINDARHFLYASGEQYDAIVSDLFVPWHSQTGYLYTVEHYQAAQKRLKPGGIFCQWLPLYQLGPEELEMIANSFASVFPVTTLWLGGWSQDDAILALVGSEEPLGLDFARLQTQIERTASYRPLPFGLESPPEVAGLFVGQWPGPEPGALLNTDDHPRVEFLAPVAHQDLDLLTGDRLSAYAADILSRLPATGLVVEAGAGATGHNPISREALRWVIHPPR